LFSSGVKAKERSVCAAFASFNVYQNVVRVPKSEQPTSSQYRFAFSSDATAEPELGPTKHVVSIRVNAGKRRFNILRGQPVSVTHTGFPPDTLSVCPTAV
jgi:hypothetical protein